MADAAQEMTRLEWTPDALNTMQSIADTSPFALEQSIAEMMQGSELWRYQDGQKSALVALHCSQYHGGLSVHVTGCTSTGSKPLQTRMIFAAIERLARQRGAVSLTLCTKHPAIAKGASRWGAHITGAIVRKELGA